MFLSPSVGQPFLTLSPLQISSLTVISGRLWVGTGGGAIFSIPLSISEFYLDWEYWRFNFILWEMCSIRYHPYQWLSTASEDISIPYCSIASAQLCYHGHRQAVRFIIAASGKNLKAVAQKISITCWFREILRSTCECCVCLIYVPQVVWWPLLAAALLLPLSSSSVEERATSTSELVS